jgi:hypothetical protein
MEMTHEECRRLLLDGDRTSAVQEHLTACAACANLDRSLRSVALAARGLAAPPVPPGLADRVMASVRSGSSWTGPSRNWQWLVALREFASIPNGARSRAMVAGLTAVAVVVAAIFAVNQRSSSPDLHAQLVVAEQKTAGAATAEMSMSAVSNVRIHVSALETVPNFMPELAGLPPDMLSRIRSQMNQVTDCLHRINQTAARDVDVTASAAGDGEVQFPDTLHARGTVVSGTAVTGAVKQRSSVGYETIVAGGNVYLRQPDGRWMIGDPAAGSLWGWAALEPAAVLHALNDSGARVQDLGRSLVAGVETEHYGFQVSSATYGFSSVASLVYVNAYVDLSTHRLVQMISVARGQTTQQGITTEWDQEATVRLAYEASAPVIEPPPSGQIEGRSSSPTGAAALLYPFASGVGVSVSYEAAQPVPAPVECQFSPVLPSPPQWTVPAFTPPAFPTPPSFAYTPPPYTPYPRPTGPSYTPSPPYYTPGPSYSPYPETPYPHAPSPATSAQPATAPTSSPTP